MRFLLYKSNSKEIMASQMERESRNYSIMHRMLSKRTIQNTTKINENDYDEKMEDYYRKREYKHFLELEIKKNIAIQAKLEAVSQNRQTIQRENLLARYENNKLINEIDFLEEFKKSLEAIEAISLKNYSNAKNLTVKRNKLLEDNVKRLEANITSLQNESTYANMEKIFLQDYNNFLQVKLTNLQSTLTNATMRKKILIDYVKLLETNITTMMEIDSNRNKIQEDSAKRIKDNIPT